MCLCMLCFTECLFYSRTPNFTHKICFWASELKTKQNCGSSVFLRLNTKVMSVWTKLPQVTITQQWYGWPFSSYCVILGYIRKLQHSSHSSKETQLTDVKHEPVKDSPQHSHNSKSSGERIHHFTCAVFIMSVQPLCYKKHKSLQN